MITFRFDPARPFPDYPIAVRGFAEGLTHWLTVDEAAAAQSDLTLAIAAASENPTPAPE